MTPSASFRLPQYLIDYLNEISQKTGKDRTKTLIEIIEFHQAEKGLAGQEIQETKDAIESIQHVLKSLNSRYQAQVQDLDNRIQQLEQKVK